MLISLRVKGPLERWYRWIKYKPVKSCWAVKAAQNFLWKITLEEEVGSRLRGALYARIRAGKVG